MVGREGKGEGREWEGGRVGKGKGKGRERDGRGRE